MVPSPETEQAQGAQRRASDVTVVARRVAGLLVLIVGLAGVGVETFHYRHLNDLTAIAFAIGAALLVLGVIAVIAVPLLELGHSVNATLLGWFGWIPGFGLILTGITHFTDWKFYRDTGRWLTVHRKPHMGSVYTEGSVLILLGILLIAAAMLSARAYRTSQDS